MRLLGTAAVLREDIRYLREPEEAPAYERTVTTARATMGEAAFAAAWNAGRTRSSADVLAVVDTLVTELAEPSPSPHPAVEII